MKKKRKNGTGKIYCTLFRAHTLQHMSRHTAFVVVVFVVCSHRNLSVSCHQHPAVSPLRSKQHARVRNINYRVRVTYVRYVCTYMCVCVCACVLASLGVDKRTEMPDESDIRSRRRPNDDWSSVLCTCIECSRDRGKRRGEIGREGAEWGGVAGDGSE